MGYVMGDIKYIFKWDKDKCSHCKACIDYCSFDAIQFEDDELLFNPCRCRRCEACRNVCENEGDDALYMEFLVYDEKPADEKESQEKDWLINTSCHLTCDGFCDDCNGRGVKE